MGPLFGHLARDPEPARIMKQLAPRVFRWTEAMNTPHIQSPEFADFEMAFDSGDQISEGALNLFRLCLEAAGQLIPRTAEIYNEWVMDKLNEPDNTMISKEVDEPSIGRFETVLRGVTIQNSASLYSLWVHQRTFEWFDSKEDDERETISEFLSEFGAENARHKLKRSSDPSK